MSRRAILCDWDGTIADSHGEIAYHLRRTAQRFDIEVSDVSHLMGYPLRKCMIALGIPEEHVAEAMELYVNGQASDDVPHIALFPGVRESLGLLRVENELLVGIASAKGEARLAEEIQFLQLGTYLDVVSGAPNGRDKPKVHLINDALAVLGVEPQNAVMVGDRVFDMEGARLAGVHAVGATWSGSAELDLRQAGAEAIASSWKNVVAIVREQLF